MRGLLGGLLDESFGCGGLTLASELGQSQLPDVLQKPASKGNSSTIATPSKQCQTQIFADVTGRFQRSDFVTCYSSATLPLAMDYLWTPWRYAYVSTAEKTTGCVFCDAVESQRR